jgi:MYXO-CTERM domain-containing protein
VNVETASRRPRWGSWLLIGIGFAFAWLAMSFVLGLGSSEARADDSGGLLGGVTSTIDNTVRAATNTTAAVTTPVVQTAVQTTATVPVVGPTVTQVVTTTKAVASATQPITSSTAGLVTGTTAPVVKAVDSTVTAILDTATSATAPLPVVGSVVGTVGSVVDSVDLTGTVGAVTGVVDDTVGAVTGTVADVVSAPGSTSTVPGIPSIPGVSGTPGLFDQGATPGGVATTIAGDSGAASVALDAMLRTAHQAAAMARATASVVLTLSPADGALRFAGDTSPVLGAATPGGTSTGSSGAGPGGATALLAFGLFFAHRAWVRRRVSKDEQAPSAPVYDTDVAPD